MPRELINPSELHPTPGFSHISRSSGTTIVCFAGQTALAADFSIISPDDLRGQTVAAMRNLETAMRAARIDWDDIVSRTIYTTLPQEFEMVAEAIAEVTGGAADPPQTIVGVVGLALPGLLIEIEAMAVVS